MEIRLKTLTPLWTGGIDQTCDRLHETGLIGSLRWWYEALVRGLGGYACDPTQRACQFNEEKYYKSKATNERDRLLEAGVCDACQLFGCTGWGRKFRLSVSFDGQKLLGNQKDVLIPSGRVYKGRDGTARAGGWFVFSESRVGEIKFTLTPLRDADLRLLHTILALISRYASLGPKGASGYGVIQADVQPGLGWLQAFGNQQPARNNTLPDFRDFFFARFRFQEPTGNPDWWKNIHGIQQAVNGQLDDGSSPNPLRKAQKELEQMKQQGILPIAPAIRNWLRYQWQHELSNKVAHFVFGEAQAVCPKCYQPGFRPDEKNDKRKKNDKRNWCPNCKSSFDKGKEIPATASKIQVSYAYRIDNNLWEFRIWGWLPCSIFKQNNQDTSLQNNQNTSLQKNRDTFLQSLRTALGQNEIWQFVFGANQITPNLTEWHELQCNQTDGKAYLMSLFGGAQ